jgi:hypothetical protein
MKNIIVGFIASLLASGCGAPGGVAEEKEALLGGVGGIVAPPPALGMVLSVDQIEPTLPIEQRPVYLHFSLWNDTPVVRTGLVQANLLLPNGSRVYTNAWNVRLAPYASTLGILEVAAPYASPSQAWEAHYFDASAPYVAAESTVVAGTMPVAMRVEFDLYEVYVASAVDSFWGDRDTAYLDTTVDGTLTDSKSLGLGYLHNNSSSTPVTLMSPRVDLVPGTSHVASFRPRIGRWINTIFAQASDVTMAAQTISLSGDNVRALVPDNPRGGTADVGAWFCNGVQQPACGAGFYFLDTDVWRVSSDYDTLSMLTYVAQTPANQEVHLSWDPSLSYQFVSGSGIVRSDANGIHYTPPAVVSAPMLVKLVFTAWQNGETATVYIEVRPAS